MSRRMLATVTSEMGACWLLGCVTQVFITGHNSLLSQHKEWILTNMHLSLLTVWDEYLATLLQSLTIHSLTIQSLTFSRKRQW